MKRKNQTPAAEVSESPVAPEILDGAKRLAASQKDAGILLEPARAKSADRCAVCGGEASQMAGEPLCWVCRRLKISAWKEAEQQAQAQE